jgi:hypothetical protein
MPRDQIVVKNVKDPFWNTIISDTFEEKIKFVIEFEEYTLDGDLSEHRRLGYASSEANSMFAFEIPSYVSRSTGTPPLLYIDKSTLM